MGHNSDEDYHTNILPAAIGTTTAMDGKPTRYGISISSCAVEDTSHSGMELLQPAG